MLALDMTDVVVSSRESLCGHGSTLKFAEDYDQIGTAFVGVRYMSIEVPEDDSSH